ncbi:MAG: polysaccharide deacetylase family protein [Oscillospiraceae bacterium]|nr:polysaccharide deacetylase family protein [Oscillospiraceae bacterium]
MANPDNNKDILRNTILCVVFLLPFLVVAIINIIADTTVSGLSAGAQSRYGYEYFSAPTSEETTPKSSETQQPKFNETSTNASASPIPTTIPESPTQTPKQQYFEPESSTLPVVPANPSSDPVEQSQEPISGGQYDKPLREEENRDSEAINSGEVTGATSGGVTTVTDDEAARANYGETGVATDLQTMSEAGSFDELNTEVGKEVSAKKDYPSPDKVAYITIDDGPSREVTPGILDLLKDEGIKATFFVLPHNGVSDIYRRIIDEGHEMGNHSYSHVYSNLYNAKDIDAFIDEVQLAREFIFDNYGYLTTSFRFPGGAMSRKASIIEPRREFLAEIGYRDFDWNVETGDSSTKYKDKSAEALAARVLDNTRNRDKLIVLMHDTKSKGTTLEALPIIISGLRAQGYTFDVLQNY